MDYRIPVTRRGIEEINRENKRYFANKDSKHWAISRGEILKITGIGEKER